MGQVNGRWSLGGRICQRLFAEPGELARAGDASLRVLVQHTGADRMLPQRDAQFRVRERFGTSGAVANWNAEPHVAAVPVLVLRFAEENDDPKDPQDGTEASGGEVGLLLRRLLAGHGGEDDSTSLLSAPDALQGVGKFAPREQVGERDFRRKGKLTGREAKLVQRWHLDSAPAPTAERRTGVRGADRVCLPAFAANFVGHGPLTSRNLSSATEADVAQPKSQTWALG